MTQKEFEDIVNDMHAKGLTNEDIFKGFCGLYLDGEAGVDREALEIIAEALGFTITDEAKALSEEEFKRLIFENPIESEQVRDKVTKIVIIQYDFIPASADGPSKETMTITLEKDRIRYKGYADLSPNNGGLEISENWVIERMDRRKDYCDALEKIKDPFFYDRGVYSMPLHIPDEGEPCGRSSITFYFENGTKIKENLDFGILEQDFIKKALWKVLPYRLSLVLFGSMDNLEDNNGGHIA